MSRALLLLMTLTWIGPAEAGQVGSPASQSATAAHPPEAAAALLQGATFRSGVDLVALNVTVVDPREKPVPQLRPEDFVILEEGIEQPVSFFATEHVPLDLAILVDGSSSMVGAMPFAREAALGLARSLKPGDRAMVIEFRDAVRVRQPLTGDIPQLEAALGGINPAGNTALFTALYVALKDLRDAPAAPDARRQAVVVLSDGDDTASLIGYDDVLEEARRAGVLVYAVRLKGSMAKPASSSKRDAPSESDFLLRRLSHDTGGRAFFPAAPLELKGIYEVIATELGSQYAIGYVPRALPPPGAWRRVQVLVRSHPGARPRTRSGYYATRAVEARASSRR